MTRIRPGLISTPLMALALAASPAYVVRPHLGPFPTTLLELLLLLAIVVGMAAHRTEIPWRGWYTWPGLLLLLGATIDTALAPEPRAAAGIWKAYFLEPMLAFLVIAALARSRANARLLLAGLAVAGTIAALLNAAKALAAIATHSYDRVTAPVAIYNSANDVPLYLVPLAAVALALVLFSENRWERVLAAAFVLLSGLAIALSNSRSGWLALAAALVVVAMFSRWRWRVLAGALGISALAFALSGNVRERVMVEFRPADPNNTIRLRLALWRSAVSMLTHRPLQGGGLSGFRTSVRPYRDPAYIEQLIYPHNLVLNFWSETGLLGLAGFAWLFGSAALACRRALGAGPWPRLLAIGVIGMLAAYLLHGLTDVPYFKNDLALEFWALLGLLEGAARAANPDNRVS